MASIGWLSGNCAEASYTQGVLIRPVLLAVLALGLFDCGPHSDLENRIFTGRTETQVRMELGEPAKVNEITKNAETINGPLESDWDEIELGDKIIVWTYEVDYGRKEIYFLPGRIDAVGEFFWFNDTSKNSVF